MYHSKIERILIPTIILLFSFFSHLFSSSDLNLFLHLKIGKWIFENAKLPTADIFSTATFGSQWIDNEWLFQLFVYSLYRVGGMSAISIFRGLVSALAFFFLLKTMQELKIKNSIILILLFPTILITRQFSEFNPMTITFLFLPAEVYLLTRFMKTERGCLPLLFILVLMVIWLNSHIGFLIGYCVLLLFILIGLGKLKRITAPKNEIQPSVRLWKQKIGYLLLTAGLSVLLLFITNPYKYRIGKLFLSPNLLATLTAGFKWLTLLGFLLAIGYQIQIIINRIKTDQRIVFFCYRWFTKFATRIGIEKRKISALNIFSFFNKWAQPVWLICFGLFIILHIRFLLTDKRTAIGLGFPKEKLINKVVSFVLNNELQGNLFNDSKITGYLLWSLYPNYKVFQIPRLFSANNEQQLWKKYKEAEIGLPAWKEIVEKYKIEFFILSYSPAGTNRTNNIGLIKELDSQPDDWSLVYFDDSALIYTRKQGVNNEIVKKYSYSVLKPAQKPEEYLKTNADCILAMQEIERKIYTEQADSFVAHWLLGYCYSKLNRIEDAIDQCYKVIKRAPKFSPAYYLLAMQYKAIGKLGKATVCLQKVIELDPTNADAYNSLAEIAEKRGNLRLATQYYQKAKKLIMTEKKKKRS